MPYKNEDDRKEYQRKYYQDNKGKIIERSKQWRENHFEYSKRWQKQYYKNNTEHIKKYLKEYYQNHSEHISKQKKQYQKNNSKKIKEKRKQYRIKNREAIKKGNSIYYKNHKKECNEYSRISNQKRRKTDSKYNADCRITNAIWKSLRGSEKAGRHWETLVGYTTEDLLKRLKKTMPKGYNWNDYLEGKLHIDHRIPISAFNFTKPEHIDFQRCWALSNLQLLPAKENLIKHNKLTKPFQPALAI